MSQATDYLENALLNHVFRNTAMTSPTTVYLGLYSVAPTDSSAGTELTGNGYARQAITFGAPSPAGTINNSATVTFTASGGAWSAAIAAAISDASSGGNQLVYGSITSVTLADGDSVQFTANNITVTCA